MPHATRNKIDGNDYEDDIKHMYFFVFPTNTLSYWNSWVE